MVSLQLHILLCNWHENETGSELSILWTQSKRIN
jgi:hypothetical protein